jgi:hypothetical protein
MTKHKVYKNQFRKITKLTATATMSIISGGRGENDF